jgi:hypothetical protein
MFNVAELVERRSARAFPGPHRLVTLAAIQLYPITPLPAVLGYPPGVSIFNGSCLGWSQASINMLILGQCQSLILLAWVRGKPNDRQNAYLSLRSSGVWHKLTNFVKGLPPSLFIWLSW